jgi:ABC-2 type transport system ATP-binding protein
MDHQPAALEIESLTKTYGSGATAVRAVDAVSLSVPPGQVFTLLGPNGAGKTTIIKMIGGLVTPTAGSIRVGGYDVARQRPRAARQIGAVLEGSRNVYWPLSAWENLMYFGQLKGLKASEIKPRAQRLLTELGLWERRHGTVGSFSRGMQQKVAVSAALITDPPILLLDEPTIGLDVDAARTFKDWIAHLARDEGKAIVLTTHQLEVVQELSHRIAVIKEGTIIADLPTAELLDRHAENRFEIRLTGSLDGSGQTLPAGARIVRDGEQTTVLLPGTDERAVFHVLARLGDTGAGLVSVQRARPSLEEVFLRLIHGNEAAGDSRPTKEAVA